MPSEANVTALNEQLADERKAREALEQKLAQVEDASPKRSMLFCRSFVKISITTGIAPILSNRGHPQNFICIVSITPIERKTTRRLQSNSSDDKNF